MVLMYCSMIAKDGCGDVEAGEFFVSGAGSGGEISSAELAVHDPVAHLAGSCSKVKSFALMLPSYVMFQKL